MLVASLWAFIIGAVQAQVPAPALSGSARMFSSDAILVGDNPVAFRLWGVDAPEPGQTCFLDEVEWDCFSAAYDKLEELISGTTVTCALRQDTNRTRRGKIYAQCRTAAGVDLVLAMVEAGYALAVEDQTKDYLAAQQAADAAGVGMWKGTFDEPWVFLDQQRGGN